MTRIITGTPDAASEHVEATAALGATIAYGIPIAIAVAGIVEFGWNAISWTGATACGAIASFAFLLFSMIGKRAGLTRMDMLDLLGSMLAPPHSNISRVTGFIIHEIDGALLGVAYAYGLMFKAWPVNWGTGLVWGIILWALALILMSSIGPLHPAIRNHLEEDPGPAAMNFGRMTPIGSLLGHAVYGVVLGILYAIWPF